jgi:hypothetical protein
VTAALPSDHSPYGAANHPTLDGPARLADLQGQISDLTAALAAVVDRVENLEDREVDRDRAIANLTGAGRRGGPANKPDRDAEARPLRGS